MEEENFNWLEFMNDAQAKKDVKNSSAFKLLNENNIDTNELTGHEKDDYAGKIDLNYKDEKEKENDGYNIGRGLLSFVADMPEETGKALMSAFLNGTDVGINLVGVLYQAMQGGSPALRAAYEKGNQNGFNKEFLGSIQTFSKYLDDQKDQVAKIGEGSKMNNRAAEFVSMITQDTPYSLPIYKKFKRWGMPNWMALPVAYGVGGAIAFDDDASLFLNSEQVQGFKELVIDAENSSQEEIFNKTFRMVEGSTLGVVLSPIFKGVMNAKKYIPKLMKPQNTIAVGGSATATAVVDEIKPDLTEQVLNNETPIDESIGNNTISNLTQ